MFKSTYDTPDERRRSGNFFVDFMNYLLRPTKTKHLRVKDINPHEQPIKINKVK